MESTTSLVSTEGREVRDLPNLLPCPIANRHAEQGHVTVTVSNASVCLLPRP